jgi:hypothetical protein
VQASICIRHGDGQLKLFEKTLGSKMVARAPIPWRARERVGYVRNIGWIAQILSDQKLMQRNAVYWSKA